MSIHVLLDDQIEELFNNNKDLNSSGKNEFEVAVANFMNVKYLNGISADELIDGILGSGGDEGIDHCYIFCNGIVINHEIPKINKDSSVNIKFIQTKKENGFSVDGFRKIKEGIEEIFDLSMNVDKIKSIGANQDFIELVKVIRSLYRECAKEKGKFSCDIFYVTRADKLEIPEKIKHLSDDLKQKLSTIKLTTEFLGAQDLYDLTSYKEEDVEITFSSPPLEVKEREIKTSGYCGFVFGNTLVKSFLNADNSFKSHLTEGNVRFFLGHDTHINSGIIETAKSKKSDIFWAMNNGLTIIGDVVSHLGGNEYSISNPQIVNGCQTIHCLYDVYIDDPDLLKTLRVFVKIVKTEDSEVQADIINATNSQNPVKIASLKANDAVQRNIENYLKDKSFYYERRENFYKRQGHSGYKVISLLKMAQLMGSVFRKEAILSINDTSEYFSNEKNYSFIFPENPDLDLYFFAVSLYQKIWSLKNSDLRTNTYTGKDKTYISKGGFLFLHIASSLIFSKAKDNKGLSSIICDSIDVSIPAKKNKFSLIKKSAFSILEDDAEMKNLYEKSKDILIKSIMVFEKSTGKEGVSAFKVRSFDKDYLIPAVKEYLDSQNSIAV